MSGRTRRIAPLAPDRWDEQTREIFGSNDRPLNILATIAHHPRLLRPFLAFAATLSVAGTLPRRISELLALRAAWNCRSAFEWGHHVEYGRAAGLSEDEIRRVTAGPDDPAWSPGDRALLRAADELHESQDVTDETWARLRKDWEEAELVEIPFVVGNYTMLSMVANSTGVPLEEGLPPLGQSASSNE
ncbi:MAG: carboxymuconolactone decarboxylase family protein [Proteobacteria bacterium]|nr:carboxymuconolactone decarboxylase family protein [Pseudomonadota bacterium]